MNWLNKKPKKPEIKYSESECRRLLRIEANLKKHFCIILISVIAIPLNNSIQNALNPPDWLRSSVEFFSRDFYKDFERNKLLTTLSIHIVAWFSIALTITNIRSQNIIKSQNINKKEV
jgi:hypothetical protein